MLSTVKNRLAKNPECKVIVDIFKMLLINYGSFEEKQFFAEKIKDYDLIMKFGSKCSF